MHPTGKSLRFATPTSTLNCRAAQTALIVAGSFSEAWYNNTLGDGGSGAAATTGAAAFSATGGPPLAAAGALLASPPPSPPLEDCFLAAFSAFLASFFSSFLDGPLASSAMVVLSCFFCLFMFTQKSTVDGSCCR